MALITERRRRPAQSRVLATLKDPVRLAVFSQALADPESEQVRRLVEELAALDPRLTAESLNFVLDKERVEALGIAAHARRRRPGRDKDYGIRFYGAAQRLRVRHAGRRHPRRLAGRERALAPRRARRWRRSTKPVHIQVFSTPT